MAKVRATVHPSEMDNGFVVTKLFDSKAYSEVIEVSSVKELATAVREMGEKAPFPCVVWCGMAERGARHPNGFKAAFLKLSRVFFKGPSEAPAVTPAPEASSVVS